MNDFSSALPKIGEYVRVVTVNGDQFAGKVLKSGPTKLGPVAAYLDCDRYFLPHLGDVMVYRGPKPEAIAPAPVTQVTSARLVEPGNVPAKKRGGNAYTRREIRKAWFWTGLAVLFALAAISGVLR